MRLVILFIALVSPVLGRIGETAAECAERYGKPKRWDKGSDRSARFEKGGYSIVVYLKRNGRVGKIEFYRSDYGTMDRPETLALLKKQGKDWKLTLEGKAIKGKKWEGVTHDGKDKLFAVATDLGSNLWVESESYRESISKGVDDF